MNDFEEEFQRSGGHKNMNVRRLRDSENRESEDSESSLLWKIWCKEEQRTQAVDAEDVEVGRNGMNSSVFVSYWEHRQRRQWHPNPVLLPGKSHGWRSLVGCSPWGHEGSDMTEQLYFHFSLSTFMHWRRKWRPTPVFLPGESQGRGSLASCCPWGHTESDTTEVT